MNANFMSSKETQKILKVTNATLVRYANKGLIETVKLPSKRRLYNVDKYLKDNNYITKKSNNNKFICYCRVSTNGQKQDLFRQREYMENKYPNHEIIYDIGSGINFNRKGLRKIIDYAINGQLRELVISYKDRLCRIGYDMLEYILLTYSKTLIIIDKHKDETINEEISNDILEIITVYSAKIHGMRNYIK
jgi:putative resolvase